MNEGIGGISVVVVIIVFIVFATGYMAFNVNYTKAFRMKNKIISTYEKYNGNCEQGTTCEKEIKQYAKEIGYYIGSKYLKCDNADVIPIGTDKKMVTNGAEMVEVIDGSREIPNLYCEYKIKAQRSAASDKVFVDSDPQYYYRIVTRINIQMPIIGDSLGLRFLTVSGDTRIFSKPE